MLTTGFIESIINKETRQIGGNAMAEDNRPDHQRMDLVFELLHGFIEADPPREVLVEERKEIDALVDRVYRHRLRLCNRAGLDFEDRDMVGIIDAYEQMNSLVARLMYEQGHLDGRLSVQK